jgi:hypothetical protein
VALAFELVFTTVELSTILEVGARFSKYTYAMEVTANRNQKEWAARRPRIHPDESALLMPQPLTHSLCPYLLRTSPQAVLPNMLTNLCQFTHALPQQPRDAHRLTDPRDSFGRISIPVSPLIAGLIIGHHPPTPSIARPEWTPSAVMMTVCMRGWGDHHCGLILCVRYDA